jgi:outer membrane protein
MKRGFIFLATTMLALLIFSATASAQAVKIGLVDFNRLGQESPQADATLQALQEEFAPRQREIVAMQNAFNEKRDQVQKDLEVMGPEERRNSEQQLRKEERDLARTGQEFQEDFNLRRNEALGKLQRELLREVTAFARNEGYDLVVSSDGVLYASPVIDITEQVLQRLKASFAAQPPAE